MLSYTAAHRWREIGIRLAIGARPADIRRLLAAHVGRMTLVGGLVGGLVAVTLGRLAQSFLFGLNGVEPHIMAGAVAAVIVVAIAATAHPARRADRIDPATVLRIE